MWNKIRPFLKKHESVLSYLFFGVLTTAVTYLIYLPCYNLLSFSATVSNLISWLGAVAFAYLTNKPFVFKSHDWSAKIVLPELAKFVSCRIGSGAMETGILFFAVDLGHGNGNIWKLLTSVIVVVVNYVASKLLVFRRKNNEAP